jgi:putative transcriptional regulator
LNKAYASIKRGLQQAIRHRQGKKVAALELHVPPQVDVKAVRERTGLTQEEFAATFAISLGALRHWERGDRKPRGTALVLLNVIAKDPQAVLRAVEKAWCQRRARACPRRKPPTALRTRTPSPYGRGDPAQAGRDRCRTAELID